MLEIKENEENEELRPKGLQIPKWFVVALIAAAIVGFCAGASSAQQKNQQLAEFRKQQEELKKPQASKKIALADSWYREAQAIPAAAASSGQQVEFFGEETEQGIRDANVIGRNLADTGREEGLEVSLYQRDPTNAKIWHDLSEYQYEPVLMTAGEHYDLVFDGAKYSQNNPLGLDTLRYYILPSELAKGESGAVTFAIYDSVRRVFYQACVPFRAGENLQIFCRVDEVYEEENRGRAFRLCIETKKKLGVEMPTDAVGK